MYTHCNSKRKKRKNSTPNPTKLSPGSSARVFPRDLISFLSDDFIETCEYLFQALEVTYIYLSTYLSCSIEVYAYSVYGVEVFQFKAISQFIYALREESLLHWECQTRDDLSFLVCRISGMWRYKVQLLFYLYYWSYGYRITFRL